MAEEEETKNKCLLAHLHNIFLVGLGQKDRRTENWMVGIWLHLVRIEG